LVGEQLHRPFLAALRRRGAGEGDQPGLGPAVELARAAGPVLRLAAQGGVQPLLDEPLPHPGDGGEADVEGLGDALVGPGGATLGLVGFDQDAAMGQFLGRGLASSGQLVQEVALLGGQCHKVFLHRGFLPKEPPVHPMPPHCSSQMWRTTSGPGTK